MKIPKKLKIGAHTVKIEMTNETPSNADGSWSSEDNTIQLKTRLPQTQLECTLLHEIIHALNISIDEVTCEFLAQGLYQVLKDNKMRFDK